MFRFLLIASVAIACVAAGNPNDVHAETLKQYSDITPDGHYQWEVQTSNGIAAQESGLGGEQATGGYSYYSPEGELVQISYVANQDGFQPQGSHVPTPPPIPEAILRSLDYIASHPQYVEQQSYQQQQVRRPVQQQKYGRRQF